MQKAYRIERMLAGGRPAAGCDTSTRMRLRPEPAPRADSGDADKLRAELAAVHRAIHRSKQELAAIASQNEPRAARAAAELGAVVADTEKATQKVLHNVEQIDEAAKTLSAALKNEHNQALAQDIQDHVTAIYEACNFQDMTGQRIDNATAVLKLIEDQISRAMTILETLDAGGMKSGQACDRDGLLNGPKLAGDKGHASQDDIDRMFG